MAGQRFTFAFDKPWYFSVAQLIWVIHISPLFFSNLFLPCKRTQDIFSVPIHILNDIYGNQITGLAFAYLSELRWMAGKCHDEWNNVVLPRHFVARVWLGSTSSVMSCSPHVSLCSSMLVLDNFIFVMFWNRGHKLRTRALGFDQMFHNLTFVLPKKPQEGQCSFSAHVQPIGGSMM